MLHIAFTRLLQEDDRPDATDEVFFKNEYIGKLEVAGIIPMAEFRDKIFNELIKG